MKNLYLFILLVFFIGIKQLNAQGNNCLGAQPFCSDQSYTFPASTNTTAQNGPDYECLSTQPNPAWYFLQVANAGNIDITLTNSQNEDIDFICWGPFSSPTAPCTSQLTNSGGFFGCGSYPCGNTIDCSYDPQATEIVNIPNAQVGEYYILMITNYSGNSTDISAQQTGGSGSTDCSIVDPCTITSVTGTVSSCNATNNQYTVNGTVSFTDPPTTGQLIIEDCSGAQFTYNAPFGTSQSYNFTALNSNGNNCSINAYFTDDATCTNTFNYTAPVGCVCNANAGTSTVTINGLGTNNYVLCDGDEIDIQSNNDDTPPLDNGIVNGASYSPDLGYAIYFCPPTPNTAPISDPCFSGYFTGTIGSFTETNNGGTSPLLNSLIANGVTITNNTIYIAPVTLYNGTTQSYDASCFHVGTPIEITYLQPITTNFIESCANNSSEVTISGGYPNFNSSNFTLSNITPSNISSSSTTINNGGIATLTNFNPGDNYAFDITDGNGCTFNFSSGPFGGISVQTYDTTICIGGTATLTPIISGGTGTLNYAWDNGSNNQTITTTPVGPEVNCITVTDSDGCSSGPQCFSINLHPSLTLSVSNDTTICLGDFTLISASAIGGLGSPYIYTWDNSLGNSNTHTVSPTNNTTYNVMVSDGCETPVQNASIVVNVIQPPTYSFSADITSGCPPLGVTFTANGVPNGYSQTWSFEDGGSSNTNNIISHLYTQPGCWDVNLALISPEGCVYNHSITDYICIDQPPFIDFNYTPAKPTTFSSLVDFENATTGAVTNEWLVMEGNDTTTYFSEDISHTFPTHQGGSYQVCLVSSNANGCADTLCKTVIILEEILLYLPNTFTPNGDLLNDEFIPHISGIRGGSYLFQVFNKWGELLFETTDVKKGWSGLDIKTDVYIWKIQATDIVNNEDHKFMGHVNLIK